jgi:hypothetical protein
MRDSIVALSALPASLPLHQSAAPNQAYLVRFPEAIWEQIAGHLAEDASVTLRDGKMVRTRPGYAEVQSLRFARDAIPLDANATGIHTEIHQVLPDRLLHLGHAAGRLSVPLLPARPDFKPTGPLKVRIVQILALGPISVSQLATAVEASEADVLRIVQIVSYFQGMADSGRTRVIVTVVTAPIAVRQDPAGPLRFYAA